MREREKQEDALRDRIEEQFRGCGVKILDGQVDELLDLGLASPGYLLREVDAFVGDLTDCSAEHLANLRRALGGRPRPEAAVRSKTQAAALLNDDGVPPRDAMRYVLEALTRSGEPELVNAVMQAWDGYWNRIRAVMLERTSKGDFG